MAETFDGTALSISDNSGCYKIEFGDGGKVKVAPGFTCDANPIFSDSSVAEFDFYSGDTAFYSEGDLGFSGQVQFVKAPGIASPYIVTEVVIVPPTFSLVVEVRACDSATFE